MIKCKPLVKGKKWSKKLNQKKTAKTKYMHFVSFAFQWFLTQLQSVKRHVIGRKETLQTNCGFISFLQNKL